jgi:hypothetical protein
LAEQDHSKTEQHHEFQSLSAKSKAAENHNKKEVYSALSARVSRHPPGPRIIVPDQLPMTRQA